MLQQGTTIDNILSKESTGIPIYVLTVKIDKTTVNKAVTQVFNNGTAITGAGGTVNSSSTVSLVIITWHRMNCRVMQTLFPHRPLIPAACSACGRISMKRLVFRQTVRLHLIM